MHTSKEVRKFQRRLRRRPTHYEVIFRRRLVSAGIEFKFQPIVGFYIPDFCFPRKMLIIELDGPSHNDTKDYDKRRDAFLRTCGFDVWRVRNDEMRSLDVDTIGKYPDHPQETFRSALARANALKGSAMKHRRARQQSKARELPKPEGILDKLFHQRYLASLQ